MRLGHLKMPEVSWDIGIQWCALSVSHRMACISICVHLLGLDFWSMHFSDLGKVHRNGVEISLGLCGVPGAPLYIIFVSV